MINKTLQLSVRQQAQLIQINRSTLYYKPKNVALRQSRYTVQLIFLLVIQHKFCIQARSAGKATTCWNVIRCIATINRRSNPKAIPEQVGIFGKAASNLSSIGIMGKPCA